MDVRHLAPAELGIAFTTASLEQSSNLASIIARILTLDRDRYGVALRSVAQSMNQACIPHIAEVPNDLFRAFDGLDEILGLDYTLESGLPSNGTSERIYAGSGVGVQSSYANVLCMFKLLNAKPQSRFIDLGSGYGRVALLLGILRPDIDFVGYEYVGKRVQCSNASADRAGLSGHVRFFEQDLSDPSFKIPDADFYYLYDPFTPETYQSALPQILAIGAQKPVVVVTKGRADGWLSQALSSTTWTHQIFDVGNMSLFRSSSHQP